MPVRLRSSSSRAYLAGSSMCRAVRIAASVGWQPKTGARRRRSILYSGVCGTWSVRTRSSVASVKQARNSFAPSRAGHRRSGWQWWSTARTLDQSASRRERADSPGAPVTDPTKRASWGPRKPEVSWGGSVPESVRAVLEDLVFSSKTLDVRLLDRHVRGAEPVSQRVHEDRVPAKVLQGLSQAARMPGSTEARPLRLAQGVRVDDHGRRQLQLALDAVQAGGDHTAQRQVGVRARV